MNPFYLSLLRAMVFSRNRNQTTRWTPEPVGLVVAHMRSEDRNFPRPVTFDYGATYKTEKTVPGNVFGCVVSGEPAIPVPLRGAKAPLPRGWKTLALKFGDLLPEGTHVLLRDPWLPGGWGKFTLPHPVPVWTKIYPLAIAVKE